MLVPVAVPWLWIAERVGAETLRYRIGKQILMSGRAGVPATDLRIRAKLLRIRHRQELLLRRGGGNRQ